MNDRNQAHTIGTAAEWLAARKQLLTREKELTRLHDQLAEQRRQLPWVKVDKAYVFDGPAGRQTLAELFAGRSQLLVYHFMFHPDWDAGCKSCSFWADNFAGAVPHLAQRDVTFAAISRAPRSKLVPFAARMGWSFPWLSSHGSDFNHDFCVSFDAEQLASGRGSYNFAKVTGSHEERPGLSVFARDAHGDVFHTYSCYGRGIEALNATYAYLDLVPRGRDEAGLSYPMAWVKHRDLYER